MAIKDWKKVGSNSYKKELKLLIITKYELGKKRNLYAVSVFSDYGWTSQHKVVSKDFKTKTQALKFAKSYMRKH